jgi:lipopolysaccharide transport system permease protein
MNAGGRHVSQLSRRAAGVLQVAQRAGDHLCKVWDYRHFWLSLVAKDLVNRYRRSLLGLGWSLLSPLAMTGVFCLVFQRLFHADLAEYLPFVLSGLAFWNFFSASVLGGCTSFMQAEPYIRQEPAPNMIYPLRTVLGTSFQFLISFAAAAILASILHGTFGISALLSLVPSLTLLFLFALALAIIAAFANALFRDSQHILEVALMALFYATPIVYPTRLLTAEGIGWLVQINPLAAFVRLLQQPILQNVVPDGSLYFTALVATAAAITMAATLITCFDREIVFYL